MNDLKFTFLQLRKNPGFTAVAMLSLALGIGANTAIFSYVDRLLVRPLPVEKPHELAVIGLQFERDKSDAFNYPLYTDYRDRSGVFTALAAYSDLAVSLTVDQQAERAQSLVVTENYFTLLGVEAAVGRSLRAELDGQSGADPAIVISHGLWVRRFGGDPAVIGRTVHVNAQLFTVVGVAPSEFNGTIAGYAPDLYLPITMRASLTPSREIALDPLQTRFITWLNLLGRLKPGVSREQAQAALRTLSANIQKIHPQNTATEIVVEDGSQGHNARIAPARLPLLLVQVTVALLLLIACANVANLLLARAAARQKEIAVRLSVGASRARLVRQLLTESVLLALASGVVGLVFAVWISDLLATFRPPMSTGNLEFGLDWRVLTFALLASFATGLIFGVVPALQATRPDLVQNLKEGPLTMSGTPRRWNLRSGLAVTQVALSLLVLVCAGLCVQSAQKLQAVNPGFEPAKVLVMGMDVGQAGYSEARGRHFYTQLLDRVRTLPGVEGASLGRHVVLGGSSSSLTVNRIEGYEPPPNQMMINLAYNVVAPDYFRTLGMPLLRGRDFTAMDSAEVPRVVIVNDALARRYWPNTEPVGKRLYLPRFVAPPPGSKSSNLTIEGQDALEVIGVVKTGKYVALSEEPRPMMYWPLAQSYGPGFALHVRSAGEPRALTAALRDSIRSLDPFLPVFHVRTLEEQRNGSLFLQRMAATMLGAFGGLGLLLAALGIYGVTAYSVSRRTREIGIRMALGARVADVLRLVLREGSTLVIIGLVLGLGAAFAATRLLRTFLFGISASDPLTYLGVSLLLLGVALLACWLPARRAAKVDPMEALRHE